MSENKPELIEAVLAEQRQLLHDITESFATETDEQSRDLYASLQLQLNRNIAGLEKLAGSGVYVDEPNDEPDEGLAKSRLNPTPGLVLADTYRLEKLLGRGGMGEV